MRRNQRGSMAVATIAALIIINLVIVTIVVGGGRDHDLTVRRVETVQAYYAAESGLNMALREVVADSDEDGDCLAGSISYDGITGNDPAIGVGQFMVTASVNGNEVTLLAYGRSGSARRQMATVVQVAEHMISFDNASSDVAASSTLAFNHTIGGESNRLLVVGVSTEAGSGAYDVDSVTYDGVPLTPSVANPVGSSTLANAEIWYMLEASLPAAGTYQVAITTSTGASEIHAGAISVYGAAQQPPEATATNDDAAAGWDTISTQIVTLTDNAWVFEAVGTGNAVSDWLPTSGQDERYDEVSGSSRGAGCTQEIATAGPVNQDWDGTGSNRMTHVLAAFAPY